MYGPRLGLQASIITDPSIVLYGPHLHDNIESAPKKPIGVEFGPGKQSALKSYKAMHKMFFLANKHTGSTSKMFNAHFKKYFMGLMSKLRSQDIV